MDQPKLKVVKVPMYDTGLGREAGYANDHELIEAGKAQRARLEELLTPETLAKLDQTQEAAERYFLNGSGS